MRESHDGVNWRRPELGLCEFSGSKKNNILLLPNPDEPYAVNFSPFIDERPGVPAEERFKAVGGSRAQGPLCAGFGRRAALAEVAGAAGLRPRRFRHTKCGILVADRKLLCALFPSFRGHPFRLGPVRRRLREISHHRQDNLAGPGALERAAADEFRANSSGTALYQRHRSLFSCVPHIYLAFPMRFVPGRRFLSPAQFAAQSVVPGYANFRDAKGEQTIPNEISDSVFMTSRGGYRYDRTFPEAFIRPGLDLGNWTSRNGMTARGVIATGASELSLYHQAHYAQTSARLDRYILRLDGFASVNAPAAGGEMITRPLKVSDRELLINFATSAAGGVRVEVQEPDGEPIPGFTLAESQDLVGDSVEYRVTWGAGNGLAALVGRPVRLRFVMKDADLYSLRFAGAPSER